MYKLSLFFGLFSLLLIGCQKDNSSLDDVFAPYIVVNSSGETSYSVVNQVIPIAGLDVVCTVYEFNSLDVRVDSNIIDAPVYGQEYKFIPCSQCNHLKVRV